MIEFNAAPTTAIDLTGFSTGDQINIDISEFYPSRNAQSAASIVAAAVNSSSEIGQYYGVYSSPLFSGSGYIAVISNQLEAFNTFYTPSSTWDNTIIATNTTGLIADSQIALV